MLVLDDRSNYEFFEVRGDRYCGAFLLLNNHQHNSQSTHADMFSSFGILWIEAEKRSNLCHCLI